MLKGEEPRELTISMAQAGVRNSPLWEQDPRQQLAYLCVKRWARCMPLMFFLVSTRLMNCRRQHRVLSEISRQRQRLKVNSLINSKPEQKQEEPAQRRSKLKECTCFPRDEYNTQADRQSVQIRCSETDR